MVTIEMVSASEITTLQQVVEATYLPYFRHFWHDEGKSYLGSINSLDVLERHLNNPLHRYYFARLEDGSIGGYLKLIFDAPIPDTDFFNAVCLDKIYLSEAAKGRGIGKILMDFALQQALQAKADYQWLRVMDSNAYNLDFYAKNGFSILYKRILDLPNMKAEYCGIYTMVRELLKQKN
jgi:GNAT superfamily N-acetyltransferase